MVMCPQLLGLCFRGGAARAGGMFAAVWVVGTGHVPLNWLDFVPLDASEPVVRQRMRMEFPESEWPGWFKDVVAEADLPIDSASGFTVYGVAKISARGALLSGSEFKPGREGKLLMDLYHHPTDAALFKIIDAVSLKEPFKISRRHTRSLRARCVVRCFFVCFESGHNHKQPKQGGQGNYLFEVLRSSKLMCGHIFFTL